VNVVDEDRYWGEALARVCVQRKLDPSGADQIEAEHKATDLVVCRSPGALEALRSEVASGRDAQAPRAIQPRSGGRVRLPGRWSVGPPVVDWEDGGTFSGSWNLSRLPTNGGTTVTGKR
jgi:hypothetical protein